MVHEDLAALVYGLGTGLVCVRNVMECNFSGGGGVAGTWCLDIGPPHVPYIPVLGSGWSV